MAQAIIAELRERVPDVQVVFTHFSPSAERVRERIGAEFTGYLPWDTPAQMGRVLDAIRPAALAFVRTEIWPTLVGLAAQRRIPSLLVNAVLSPRSSRLKPVARYFLGPAYTQLQAVGAVNTPTAERFEQLGVPRGRARITGDARFDQVWNRVRGLDREQPVLTRLRSPSTTTLVAGSTWPSDLVDLLPAVARIGKVHPLRLIIAPHEPTAGQLRQLEGALARAGLSCGRLSALESSSAPLPAAVVVDRLGVLADLYSIGDISYVGGGFHDAGLHSIVEPAALGVPVLFGPRHSNAPEADDLAGRGGGFVVRDADSIASVLLSMIEQGDARRAASAAAVAYVQSRLGAAGRNADLIRQALTINPPGAPPRPAMGG